MRRPRPRSPPPPFAHAAARPRRPSCQPTIQPEPVPCTRALVCPPRMHSHRPARARARARHTRCGCPTHDEPFMHSVSVVAIAIPPRCTRAVLHPPQRAFMRERRARARGSEERELGWGVGGRGGARERVKGEGGRESGREGEGERGRERREGRDRERERAVTVVNDHAALREGRRTHAPAHKCVQCA